jgi:sigma-B regulation protein RsbU (phosphoserine phosphatase)
MFGETIPMSDTESQPEAELSRLELALRASNEGIWDWWPARQDIYYSRRILEFLECRENTPPNIFLEPFASIHPEDRDAFAARVRAALSPGGPEILGTDCRVLSGSGVWRWLRIRGTVVRDRSGATQRIAGSMIDISLRKTAEAQAAEERHQLRQLIDHVPLQIYFKDTASRFVLVNDQMAEWNGMGHPRDVIGKHDRDLFAASHWQEAEADEKAIMATGTPVTGKLEHEVRADGSETWVLTSKFPWYDRHGALRGTFGVSSDVTRLVKAEHRSAALASALAERNQAYEEEVQLAREIQQAFASPEIPPITTDSLTLHLDSRYLPISGLAGDFFEIVPIGHDKVGLLICDVMGHGVRSALVVAMLRGLLEKQKRSIADPAAYLRGLNNGLVSIFEKARITMFATAFYAVIDLTTGELTCSCAGHPGAILAGQGSIHALAKSKQERGPALGLVPDARYPLITRPISAGHRLLLFTDGIFECSTQGGQQFMESRLLETVRENADLPLDSLLNRIVATVLEHAQDHRFDDDVCLLGAEITAR